ncbi:RHS repeat-associated core domain-containing protein [Streptomyces zingiberis]|uniref:RHS repeat-associated core domain-containing protein n=1 Tax=Streptomyces zingiberis TaxID=2053010 RepID=UPI002892E967|nr:RHS repeat-associated core domain-containing protein [Streptomyces zingiberis]
MDTVHPARCLHPVRHHHESDLRRRRQHPAFEGRFDDLHQRRSRHHRAERLRHGHRFRPRALGNAGRHEERGRRPVLPDRRQNSAIGLVDASGKRTATYSYGPYGETRTDTGTNQPFRYTSAYLDTSGLYKMGARYYDPNLGRFTQPDPSGKESNAYLYAAGDPVNRVDPTGLFSFFDGLMVAAGVVGLAAGGVGLLALGGVALPTALTTTATVGGFFAGVVSGAGLLCYATETGSCS